MTSERLQRTKRIAVVLGRLRNVAEVEMAGLRAKAVTLEFEQEKLLKYFNNIELLQGLFVSTMAQRMKSLSRKISANEADLVRQQAKLVELAGKEKTVLRISQAGEAGERRKREEAELREIIDSTLVTNKTSLR